MDFMIKTTARRKPAEPAMQGRPEENISGDKDLFYVSPETMNKLRCALDGIAYVHGEQERARIKEELEKKSAAETLDIFPLTRLPLTCDPFFAEQANCCWTSDQLDKHVLENGELPKEFRRNL